jgi:hypothetical protein
MKEEDYEDINEETQEQEVIDSSLEIGGQIHQQSEIVRKFKHLPRDLKYSKFNNIDVANYTLKSKAYDLYEYVRKAESMALYETQVIKEKKKELYYIESLEEFKEYLRENSKMYIYANLRNLSDKDLQDYWVLMKKQLKEAENSGFLDVMYKDKEHLIEALEMHEQNFVLATGERDDFGLLNSMLTNVEVNKARSGWATKMMNTTINITKEENLRDEVEEEPEDNENNFKKSRFLRR